MESGSESAHTDMCCYRCSRCKLEVYRSFIQYDRRDRPICDPDCDGSKPSACIWCDEVIVGRPMLMFDKKVHRECWQYCVAKFGYDEVLRRYAGSDWDEFRGRDGHEVVREVIEEFFDKFCTEMVSDEEAPCPEEEERPVTEGKGRRGKKGDEEWERAITKVLHNKKHTSLPNIACTDELGSVDARVASSVRGGHTDDPYEEMSLKEMLSDDRTNALHRIHSAEERKEWLQAVQKSVRGDAFFNRESWADEMYSTISLNREQRSPSSISIANTFEGQRSFVDDIIEEAVAVVEECNDGDDVCKTIDGRKVVDFEKVYERATRKMTNTLTMSASGSTEDADRHSEFNVIGTGKQSLTDQLIDEAAGSYYVESSDDECRIRDENACQEGRDVAEQVKVMFNKEWKEAMASPADRELITSPSMSNSWVTQRVDNANDGDTDLTESTVTLNGDDANASETVVSGEKIDGKKPPKKRRKRKRQNNVTDDSETSAKQSSSHEFNSNVDDPVCGSGRRNSTIGMSRSDLVFDEKKSDCSRSTINLTDSARTTTNITDSARSLTKVTDSARSSTKFTDSARSKKKTADTAQTTTNITDSFRSSTKFIDSARSTNKVTDSARSSTKVTDSARSATKVTDSARSATKMTDSSPSATKMNDSARSATKVTDSARSATKVTDSARSSTKVTDSARSATKVTDSARSATKVTDSARSATKVTDSARSATKVTDSARSATKMTDSSRSATKMTDSARSATKMNDSARSATKVTDSARSATKVTDSARSATKVTDSARSATKMNDSSRSTNKVTDSARSATKMTDSAPSATKMTDSAPSATKMTDSAPSATKMNDSSRSSPKVTDSSRSATKMNDTSRSSPKVTDSSRSATKMTDSARSATKMNDSSRSSPKVTDSSRSATKMSDSSRSTTKITDSFESALNFTGSSRSTMNLTDSAPSTTDITNRSRSAKNISDSLRSTTKITESFESALNTTDSSRSTTKITDSSRSTTKMTDSSRSTTKMTDSSRSTTKMTDSSRSTTKMTDSARSGINITDSARSTTKMTDSSRSGINITDSARSTTKMTDSSLSGINITDSARSTTKMTDSSRSGINITDSARSTTKMTDSSPSGINITDSARSTTKMTDSSRSGINITDSARSTTKMTDSSRSGINITDSARSTTKMTDSSRSATKMTDSSLSATKMTDSSQSGTNFADSPRNVTNIAESGVEIILTEEQLDELFRDALVMSDDPARLGGLINEFKAAVGDIQHTTNMCPQCAKPNVSTATENGQQQRTTDRFDTVLAQLMDEVKDLRNSILIFRKYARPDHFYEASVDDVLLSTPQGEVYGTGNVLIIFDYGEEPLESDSASVYEYLANIHQECDSPRCPLHRRINDVYPLSEGNISMDDGSNPTDEPRTYREVNDEPISPVVSLPETLSSMGLEDMSTYNEALWAELQKGSGVVSGSLQGSSRVSDDVFCTEAEALAWTAMLNAGTGEEVSSARSGVDLTDKSQNNVDDARVEEGIDIDVNEKSEKKPLASSIRPSGDEGVESTTKQQPEPTDAQLLDRLRSIKRINFDDSATNLRTTTSSRGDIVVRKSVSDSDVTSYELCACVTQPSDASCGSDTECTWNEVRQIVTEDPSAHLMHSASVGTNRAPVEVYQVAIEITINKRDRKKDEVVSSRSSIDMLSFFQESDKISDSPKAEFEHKILETITKADGDFEKTQADIIKDQDVDPQGANIIPDFETGKREIVAEIGDGSGPQGELCKKSSGHEIDSDKSSKTNVTGRRSIKELKINFERQSDDHLDLKQASECTSDGDLSSSINASPDHRLKQTSDVDLFSSENASPDHRSKQTSEMDLFSSEYATNHPISKQASECTSAVDLFSSENTSPDHRSKQTSDVDLFSSENASPDHRSKQTSEMDLFSSENATIHPISKLASECTSDVDLFSSETTSPDHRSKQTSDVDLLSNENITTLPRLSEHKLVDESKPDDLLLSNTGSHEDLPRADLTEAKSKVEVEKERNESIEQSPSEQVQEPLVLLEEKKENIPCEISNENLPSGQHNNDLVDVGVCSIVQGSIEPNSSIEVADDDLQQEHIYIGAPGSKGEAIPLEPASEEVHVESSVGGSGEVAFEKSEAYEIETTSSRKNIVSPKTSRQTIEQETTPKMPDSGDQTDKAGVNVGEDDSKSCEMSSDNVSPAECVEEESQDVTSEEKGDTHSSEVSVSLGASKEPEASLKTLIDDDMVTAKEPEIAIQTSPQPSVIYDVASICTHNITNTFMQPDLVTEVPKEQNAGIETSIIATSTDNVETPIIAKVDSVDSREIHEHFDRCGFVANDIDYESLLEEEMGSVSLCEDTLELDPSSNTGPVLSSIHKRTKTPDSHGAIPKTNHDEQPVLSRLEIDSEASRRDKQLSRKNSNVTTASSDRESYKGNSTEEELEVCTLLSGREYGVDHEWSNEPIIESGDLEGASVLTLVRGSSTRVDVGASDVIVEAREDRVASEASTGGEQLMEASSSDVIRTILKIDENKTEDAVNKKDELTRRREKNTKALLNENLDEISRLDDDANAAAPANESVAVVKVGSEDSQEVPGSKSKRKKDKKERKKKDGKKKGSPTCVIL